MATDNAASHSSLFGELFAGRIFKRNQGRLVRQLTALAIWVVVALISYRLYDAFFRELALTDWPVAAAAVFRQGVPLLILAAGMWFGFRVVNWPRFAEFLISVETELHKVSWPGRSELVKASLVVIFVIFFLAMLLFTYDVVWATIFQFLDIS